MLRAGRAGGGRAIGILSIWAAWESLMLRLYRVEPVRPGGLFLFRVQRYRGRDTRLADGMVVRRGARIVELHLDNRRLLAMRGERGYAPWRAVETLRGDLRALARRIAARELGEVEAIHGISLMGTAGAILGFEVHELRRSWRLAFVRYFMAGIDAVYHPDGLHRLDTRARDRWPVEVWMSTPRAVAFAGSRDSA